MSLNFIDTNEWTPVHTLPGFERCLEYYVNREGQILSTKRKKSKILKATKNESGYMQVRLTQLLGRAKTITVPVHKIVAFAFLPTPPVPYGNKKGQVNIDHIDDNKQNNHFTNLQYLPNSANSTKKAYKRGLGQVTLNMSSEERVARRKENNRLRAKKYRECPEYRRSCMLDARRRRAEQKAGTYKYHESAGRPQVSEEQKAEAQKTARCNYRLRKRAEQKAAKIDKDSPETSSNG